MDPGSGFDGLDRFWLMDQGCWASLVGLGFGSWIIGLGLVWVTWVKGWARSFNWAHILGWAGFVLGLVKSN